MRDVAILGVGSTKFGRGEEGVVELLAEASVKALEDSNAMDERIDAVYVGNMSSGEFEGRVGIHNALVGELGIDPPLP